ncbi:Pentatricopeptide repeat [Arabidopsis thaliana x Arabidopsis arenosa]|uniref:Pentatricopeptide repeat n=1 Tax=Arabidopsis thaliana x Arabidopsis arenosa TaxID=1240361 RepID=A0A8T1Y5A9_9BRAS|nr:Pentatricopeptide repeat [Arabidopsis thaliana x Arabidopsis arenosa]
MLRSRRSRSRHGAQACAVMSAILLLASVSLLYTRLSLFSSHSPNHLRSGSSEDAVLFPDSLLVSDSDVETTGGGGRGSTTSTEDRIDEHDDAIEDDGGSNEEDENQDAEQEQEVDLNRNKGGSSSSSSSGFYFDHVNGVIRRAFNKRSIDEWDYDYTGFSIDSDNLGDKSRAAFGSDDVPLDESIRRKIVEVKSVEDALLLKSGKKVSPLREGWGDWFDKKGDFLRRDRMFKSNIETLNPLNNPMLQDPDSVGITGLTRGDKVVQKWRLNQIKRNPFMAKKPLSVVSEKKEPNEVRESRERIRLQNRDDGRHGEVKRGERKTLDDDKKIERKEQTNTEFEGKHDEVAEHMYADGTKWGYYPGIELSLSFSDFMDSFFRKEKCSMRVFMVWNSPGWMFSVRHQRGIESLLSQHRDACVVVFSETVELDFFRNSFVKDGYKVAVAMPNLDELLQDTPTHVFASVWFDWRKTKFYPTHYSELVRLAALYKYGGVYLDSDVLVLGSLSSLRNTIGMEDQAAGESLNGAVMSFEKKSPFLLECLNEYYLTYDDKCLRCNGADLLTRVAKRFLNGKNRRMTQQELNIRPSSVFFPISSHHITKYFTYPAIEDEKSQQDESFKKILNESLTFHFWNSITSSLIPEPESLVARLISSDHESSDLSPPSSSSPSSSPSQSLVKSVCSLVYNSYLRQNHVIQSPHRVNLDFDANSLTHEQAITVVASLASESGSMVALCFFYWAVGFKKFRHFMRLYLVTADSLIANGNLQKAHEVMRCMLRNFSEIGRLNEAVGMVMDMQNQGLSPSSITMNRVLEIAIESGLIEYAENVFDEMSVRGVCPDSSSFKVMVIGCFRDGKIQEADRWLSGMIQRGFIPDNATCTLILSALCENGLVNRAIWYFRKMIDLGFKPNLINFTSLIDGLCKKGSIKQAFEMLEEMVRNGWKPNVYTHTALIDGLCKRGWTEKAFRLFLKLVRSDTYKPNVHTYTSMIGGYCKEDKLNRAEMLFSRMKEQGLFPNVNTYTTLIDGHCKADNFERAYELMNLMGDEGFRPNIYTYNAVIDSLCKKSRAPEAYELLNKAFSCGLEADRVTYTILIQEQCKQSDIKQALAFFCRMNKSGFEADMRLNNILIAAFCRQKKMKESERLFQLVVSLGLVPTKETYTSMISGYCKEGDIDLALKYFHNMKRHGCVPDSFTYGSLISGLCKKSMVDKASKLYETMIDKGLSPPEVTRVTLAYEYCKRNDSANAMILLEPLDKKLWIRTVRTLVRKLCSEKKVGVAALFFQKLLEKDSSADRVTLAAFTTACSESGKNNLVADLTERISRGVG